MYILTTISASTPTDTRIGTTMAEFLNDNTNGSGPGPSFDTQLLETFIPGYGLASRILATYFHLDLSSYIPALIASGIVLAVTKYLYHWLYSLFTDHFISTAEIRLDDEIYTYLMFWMARQSFTTRTTNFIAGTKLSGRNWYYSDDESDSEAEDEEEDGESFDDYWSRTINRDKYKKLRFTPSQGTHYFRFNGQYIAFSREREDSGKKSFSSVIPERLYLSCAGRNPNAIKDLLAEAQRAYVARDGTRTVIYRGQKGSGDWFDWVRCMARPPRPLSTVILDAGQKEAFIADIKDYLHPKPRRWYSNRGIPYRRGYLLHGPPGTGKTSLCFAASGLLGLPLYLLNLNSKSLGEDSLMSLFSELPRRCIVLLEDVDSAGITKKREEDSTSSSSSSNDNDNDNNDFTNPDDDQRSAGLSLSALLNVIDGVAASEGRILVMTTNHAEKLDPALLRPGRVDMTVTFGYTSKADIEELFSAIYSTLEGDCGSKKQRQQQYQKRKEELADGNGAAVVAHEKKKAEVDAHRVARLAAEFSARVPGGEFTAAEIQGYLLNYKHAPADAIEGAGKWAEGVLKKRKA